MSNGMGQTPTERLVLFSLRETSPQTLEELRETTGTKTLSTLKQAVGSLHTTGHIGSSRRTEGDGLEYFVPRL